MVWLKRTKITTETHEFTTIRLGSGKNAGLFCSQCGGRSTFYGIEKAVELSSMTARQLIGLIETDELHFRETPGGNVLICRVSLETLFEGIRGTR